jgi:hypothetical protein
METDINADAISMVVAVQTARQTVAFKDGHLLPKVRKTNASAETR